MSELLETTLRGTGAEVVLGHGRRFCLIGERINPTGRRIFQEQLRAGDFSAIERDVKAQVEGGADVLDINMGVPLTDEPELLAKAIQMVQELTDLPICIDSSVATLTILATRSSRFSHSIGISSWSLGSAITAASYFLTSGRIAAIRSSSAVIELTSARPR